MSHQTCTIEFTAEELRALVAWLSVIAFQGTAAALATPLALHAGILAKLQAAQMGDSIADSISLAEIGDARRDDFALR